MEGIGRSLLAMFGFETDVLWNQVLAMGSNLWIWMIRSILRVQPPKLMPPEANLNAAVEATDADRCVCIEVVGAGGVDRMVARSDQWAMCGYNLMQEYGSHRIEKQAALHPDHVVIRNHAFSINYADICVRWGLYESALKFVGWPIVPGFDIAGTCEAAGADSGFAVGDRVFGCSLFGAYASRVVAPKGQLMRMPSGMSFEDAAALPAVAATALHATTIAGLWPNDPLGSNRHVLVHSAAGGVGDMLVKILRIRGLHVVGVVGSASKVPHCGADNVIDKSSSDWAAAARRIAPQGYRAIFDANGVSTLSTSYDLLCRNGRLVVYGFHSNLPRANGGLGLLSPLSWLRMGFDLARMPRFDPMALTLDSKAVLGFNLSFFAEETELCATYLAQLEQWVASGLLKGPPVRIFNFEDTRDAHLALQTGNTVGKMVVSVGSK